jgi:hypothetical protein
MRSSDRVPRRRRHFAGVAVSIDRRRILVVTAATMALTLGLLALTMFGPGKTAADWSADAPASDVFVRQTGDPDQERLSTVIVLDDAGPAYSAPDDTADPGAGAPATGGVHRRTAPR